MAVKPIVQFYSKLYPKAYVALHINEVISQSPNHKAILPLTFYTYKNAYGETSKDVALLKYVL